jgi:hypothetical protein
MPENQGNNPTISSPSTAPDSPDPQAAVSRICRLRDMASATVMGVAANCRLQITCNLLFGISNVILCGE